MHTSKSNKLSIHNLILSLIDRADISQLKISNNSTETKTGMTIRAEPQLKEFYQIQAENLGVSLHDH
jgi:hypothetical protein